jgi:hypothetical protein
VLSYHLVLHNNPRGVHFFSSDGLRWKLQQKLDAKGNPQPPHFFHEVIQYTDGTNATVGRRERPWMLFNKDGSPSAFASVACSVSRAVFPLPCVAAGRVLVTVCDLPSPLWMDAGVLVTSMRGGNHKGDASVWTMVQATSAAPAEDGGLGAL